MDYWLLEGWIKHIIYHLGYLHEKTLMNKSLGQKPLARISSQPLIAFLFSKQVHWTCNLVLEGGKNLVYTCSAPLMQNPVYIWQIFLIFSVLFCPNPEGVKMCCNNFWMLGIGQNSEAVCTNTEMHSRVWGPKCLVLARCASVISVLKVCRRKGTQICTVYCNKYADFTQTFAHITAQYCPKQFISGAIENKS